MIYTNQPQDTVRVRTLVQAWYRKQATRVFQKRLHALLPRFARLGLPQVEIAVRAMKTRWGSCTPSGTILLNPKLMQVPIPYIDYVIVHELCHLIEHNHGPRFYALLDQVMPDWRERREGLNRCEVG